MSREIHLIKITRQSRQGLLAPDSEHECAPPQHGRYYLTPTISIPVGEVTLLAIKHKEGK